MLNEPELMSKQNLCINTFSQCSSDLCFMWILGSENRTHFLSSDEKVRVWAQNRKLNVFFFCRNLSATSDLKGNNLQLVIVLLFVSSGLPPLWQLSRTLWREVKAALLPLWDLRPTRPQAAPAPAHTPHLEAHGTLSALWRNGSPTPSASWALTPEVEQGKPRSRCSGQMGKTSHHRLPPSQRLSKVHWKWTKTTSFCLLTTKPRWDFSSGTKKHFILWPTSL